MDLPADCQLCGACCFGDGPRYVRVTGADYARLGDDAERLTAFLENRCYMRMHDGHCAALARLADGRFACTAYAQRPDACRDMARGSSACEAELVQKGSRSGRLLPQLRR